MRRRTVLLAAIAWASGAVVQAGQIVGESPFYALDGQSAAHAAAFPLELRGIMTSEEGVSCCIYDRASGREVWAVPGEPGHPFRITAADPGQNTATVEASGQVTVLRLHESRVLAAAESPLNFAPEATISYSVTTRRLPGEPRAPRP